MRGDAALDRTGVVLSWQVQLATVRTHSGLWCKRMMMQHQGECATTSDAASGADAARTGLAVAVAVASATEAKMQQHHAALAQAAKPSTVLASEERRGSGLGRIPGSGAGGAGHIPCIPVHETPRENHGTSRGEKFFWRGSFGRPSFGGQ